MVSDFASNVSLPCPSKKKRTNRLAKLKQYKLDVRREQWLSQVKNKDCKVDLNGCAGSPPFSTKRADEQNKSLRNLQTNLREEESEDALSIHESDLESLMSCPIQSNLANNDTKESISAHSCSGSSSGSCSGSVSEEEKDGCLDNWEDVADALSADDSQHNSPMNSPAKSETMVECASADQQFKDKGIDQSNSESRQTVYGSHMNCRAWRPDDVLRPQSLPSLSKQHDISLNSDWYSGHGAITWKQRSTMYHPSSCPICYEDLDATDSSFLPCSCGFLLCLFCHKRILEVDGRCPGCRKHYDSINRNICFNR
ncbi:hypothetical protein Goshw_004463 [Gossypium schwendimanii]|uniref:RING-type domain-containing protein n=1 Tax=Gossypium schwendimanii TaxID=34291 RepID=A0A7J9MLP2_GOSSC|nr:hypothetical protein [Gossypium schwendimanii]